MSVNLSVKNEIKKHKGLTDLEEVLVNKYEAFYKQVYFLVFCARVIFLLLSFSLVYDAISLYKQNNTPLESEFSLIGGIIFSIFGVLMPLAFSYTLQGSWFQHSTHWNFKKLVNDLEDEIVKLKLEQRFHSDKKLRNKVEDFHIEINNLTRAKYETAFQFYIYEFYIYALISTVTGGFFIFKIL